MSNSDNGAVLLENNPNTIVALQSEAGENSAIVNSSQEAPNKSSRPQSETGNDDTTTPEKKKRKTSKVWNEFTVVVMKDGTKKNQCNYCRARLAYQNTGSTTHLNRHMLTCGVRLATISGKTQQVLAIPTMEPDGRIGNLTSFRFDKEKVRDILAKMIIVHEYPFRMVEHTFFQLLMKTLNPKFESMSRVTVRSDCMKIYALEKKKIKALLGSVDRISLTSDLWTSNQTIGYMCLTAHFLDNDWNLQKRVLSFISMPPPHTGLMISDSIFSCLNDWGIENKISTITLDNASSNDSAVRHLKDSFTLKKSLFFDGKIFHVRCCAHILNIMVQDGLVVIHEIISKVRESVKYIKGSPARLHKFNEIARQLQLSTTKRLILDVSTRWNSTYAMLESALQFKDVFPRYHERDPNYKSVPSYEDWEKTDKIMEFLEVFNEATNVFSGYEYPTANLFLPEVWKIKELLELTTVDDCDYMKDMAFKMKDKFDKYWGECNLLMTIASILDPRYKMQLVIFCFSKIYLTEFEAKRKIDVVKDAIYDLYNYYVEMHKSQQPSQTNMDSGFSNKTSLLEKNKTKSRSEFDMWAQSVECVTPSKSDLDAYLEEGFDAVANSAEESKRPQPPGMVCYLQFFPRCIQCGTLLLVQLLDTSPRTDAVADWQQAAYSSIDL
ncbi:zinc finger BED domain-containing protein RICESLEEPER 2-like [Canna indica]|uniref:Zinc finger BED domain-containing protein RICESLEEPER 2-like n=1 Tax=Canna indica TaxID=4628 RepID=A0AAQ3KCE3_9LILI|nr:zinc finger BED domain-containing protein RICESLEEPER 2-like [Canna indica]